MEELKLNFDSQAIRKSMELYLVSDRMWLDGRNLHEDIEKSILGGATFVQLREKELDEKTCIEEARQVKYVCATYHIPFVINDDVDIMLAVDADGVHVGQSDMQARDVRIRIGNDKILGVSVQNVAQAIEAQEMGADYVGVGAMFSTSTKQDADDVSFTTIKEICDAITIPVVAIGGITKDNLMQLKGTGIDGVAVVSAIMAQEDITLATQELKVKTAQLCQ